MKIFTLIALLSTQLLFSEEDLTQQVKSKIISLLSTDSDIKIETAELNQTKESVVPLKKEESIEEQKLREEEKKRLEKERLEAEKRERERVEAVALSNRINELIMNKKELDEQLLADNIWASAYRNHERYQALNKELEALNEKISFFKNRTYLNKKEKVEYESILEEYHITEGKLSQLQEYKDDPFVKMVASPELEKVPEITNPIDVITGISFQKHLKTVKEGYRKKYLSLNDAITKLYEKNMILQELVVKTRGKPYKKYVKELEMAENKLADFESSLEILKTSLDAFEQKVSQLNLSIDEEIKKEINKSIVTGSIILFILLFFFFIKYLVKKYMSENDLYYGTNKVINFLFILLILIILLVSYLENIEHLITFLSFASAGIAIALKDWFMSIIGWFVILFSGSIHVGDRMKFVKDGVEYVGDIVDISVLRMTLHEDVTLTTISHNKRSGRIIFIPNNYIFTDMIANYSHSGLKTVWDGIEFMITFDSNIPRAQAIAKEVTRKYSKGYTDMTRKQLNKLRSKYSVRNTAVEPRIFGFFDAYGVKISAWYLTNAYATLTLRSTISMEILAKLQEADDIHLALPSQSLYMNRPAPRPLLEGEEPTAEHGVNETIQ